MKSILMLLLFCQQRIQARAESESVIINAPRPFAAGSEVKLNDARPNSERLLATGALQPDNDSNYLLFEAALVPSDKMYSIKREVLQSLNLQVAFLASRTLAFFKPSLQNLPGPA
jgi:hypothetical protein